MEFFHIKLERHDVIYAEGAPIDTLLNVDESTVNFADYFRRYGTPKTEEVAMRAPLLGYWEEAPAGAPFGVRGRKPPQNA